MTTFTAPERRRYAAAPSNEGYHSDHFHFMVVETLKQLTEIRLGSDPDGYLNRQLMRQCQATLMQYMADNSGLTGYGAAIEFVRCELEAA